MNNVEEPKPRMHNINQDVDGIINRFLERHNFKDEVQHLNPVERKIYQNDLKVFKDWKERESVGSAPSIKLKGWNEPNYDVLYLSGSLTGLDEKDIEQNIANERNDFQKKLSLATILNNGSRVFMAASFIYALSLYFFMPLVEVVGTLGFTAGIYCMVQSVRWMVILILLKRQAQFIANHSSPKAMLKIKKNVNESDLEKLFVSDKYKGLSSIKYKKRIMDLFVENEDKTETINQATAFVMINIIATVCLLIQSALFYFAEYSSYNKGVDLSLIFSTVLISALLLKFLTYFHFKKKGMKEL